MRKVVVMLDVHGLPSEKAKETIDKTLKTVVKWWGKEGDVLILPADKTSIEVIETDSMF